MLSKSLIQFSVGLRCVPALLFDLRPNYGGGNENNGDILQKVPCTHLVPSVSPTLQQATTDPRLCWRLLDTAGQVWVCPLWGHVPFSWVLVSTRFCLCPPRNYFPVLCKLLWRASKEATMKVALKILGLKILSLYPCLQGYFKWILSMKLFFHYYT